MDAQLSRYDFARARQEMHNVSSRSVVPERNTSEDDYASQAMQQNTKAGLTKKLNYFPVFVFLFKVPI